MNKSTPPISIPSADPIKNMHNSPVSQPLDIHAQDPDVAREVMNFVNSKKAAEGLDQKPEQEFQAPPEHDFVQHTKNDVMVTEALISTDSIEVTEDEKVLFLKALGTESVLRFPVTLMNGNFIVDLRTRSTFEQQRCFDLVDFEVARNEINKENAPLQVTRFQQYCMLLMVERVNGRIFSECNLEKGPKIEEHFAMMRKAVEDKFENNRMQSPLWTTLLNAMRIFESKCAKMLSEAQNEGFWKPLASA